MDVKIIKEVTEHHWELERAHMRKLYRSVRVAGVENMYIDCEEMKGYAQTNKLPWFTDEFSKIYRANTKAKILFASKCEEVRGNAKSLNTKSSSKKIGKQNDTNETSRV